VLLGMTARLFCAPSGPPAQPRGSALDV